MTQKKRVVKREEFDAIATMHLACFSEDGSFAKDGGWDNAAMAMVCSAYLRLARRLCLFPKRKGGAR